MTQCPKCHGYLADGVICGLCCTHETCLRYQYIDGECKRHHDETRYALMRALERGCRRGTRVLCRADGGAVLAGQALTPVRIVPRDIPSRERWPSVLVLVDGHNEPVEWRAMDVELAA
jgi:hypothetical protein